MNEIVFVILVAMVFPQPVEEVPKEPEKKVTCVRPPSDGYNAGKPCVKA